MYILITAVAAILMALMIFFVFKGATSKKQQACPAQQWTTIISNFATGTPQAFRIQLQTASGEPVTGEYSEQRYTWIFPNAPTTGALSSEMSFQRHWINARYIVMIKPDQDVTVTIS